MKNKLAPLILTVLSLLLGLALPFLIAAGQDAALARQTWKMNSTDAHYAYQGTLMNRVIALNAYLNRSPAVSMQETEPDDPPADLIDSLSLFTPVSGAELLYSSSFTLSPKQYSAEYRYLSLDYSLHDGSLSVTLDTETLLPLRIELAIPAHELNKWMDSRSLWDILRSYAALLNLGEPTDDESNYSTVLHSQSAQLRGTAFKATVTVIPSTGSLLLKLSASTPA